MFRSTRRAARGPADAPRGRFSYANVAATIALVVALGGGTAYAAHKLHYLITSTKQISPSVLGALKTTGQSGAAGPAGPSGPKGATGGQGIQGIQGVTGLTGPQGPGAEILANGGIAAGNTTTAVGTIPVQLDCIDNGANTTPKAQLQTTETYASGGIGAQVFGGTYYTTYSFGATGTSGNSWVFTGGYDDPGPTPLNGPGLANASDTEIGTVLLTHYAGVLTIIHPVETSLTETVTFEVEVYTGTSGGHGSCSVNAQIVPTS
jgi:hypothetical protein